MITPNITKETCEGTACIPIQDALFRRREIYCTGEIDTESANSIIVQLLYQEYCWENLKDRQKLWNCGTCQCCRV